MRILVTGALGAIGTWLVPELMRRGHDVLALDLRHDHRQHGFRVSDKTKPTYVRADIGEYREIKRVFDELGPFDYVYNLAAEFGRWNGEDYYERMWRSNVIGLKHLIGVQEHSNKFRLIHFSSSEVYGDLDRTMTEEALDNIVIGQLNDYAISKRVNEQQIINSIKQNKTRTVIVRPFNFYGPGEHYSPYRSVNVRFLYCCLTGTPIVVYKGHFRSSTYIEDGVMTIASICERFKSGEIYNISSQSFHSIETLADICLRITKSNKDLVKYLPSEKMTTMEKNVDNRKSIEHLGHKDTIDLHEGMKRTAKWLKETYGL